MGGGGARDRSEISYQLIVKKERTSGSLARRRTTEREKFCFQLLLPPIARLFMW